MSRVAKETQNNDFAKRALEQVGGRGREPER